MTVPARLDGFSVVKGDVAPIELRAGLGLEFNLNSVPVLVPWEAAISRRTLMATLKDILAGKDSKVISVDPRATVMEAAVLMNQYRIGFLVAMDGERPVGVFSERDILRRVVVARLDPGKTLVQEVMTTEMLVCNPTTSVEEARSVMKNRRIRHLPVVDNNERLVGLVSIGDLNAFNANAQEQTLHVLREYIYGRT